MVYSNRENSLNPMSQACASKNFILQQIKWKNISLGNLTDWLDRNIDTGCFLNGSQVQKMTHKLLNLCALLLQKTRPQRQQRHAFLALTTEHRTAALQQHRGGFTTSLTTSLTTSFTTTYKNTPPAAAYASRCAPSSASSSSSSAETPTSDACREDSRVYCESGGLVKSSYSLPTLPSPVFGLVRPLTCFSSVDS